MESLNFDELPTRVPVLPYKARVLLPGGVIRVLCTSPSSIRLVETQLWQKKKGQGAPLLGLVPAMQASSKRSTQAQGIPVNSEKAREKEGEGRRGEGEEQGDVVGLKQWLGVAASHFEPIDFQHGFGGAQSLLRDELQWHKRGVLARAVHVGKRSSGRHKSTTFTLILEGLCRFELMHLSSRGPFHMADIQILKGKELSPVQEEQVVEMVEDLLHLGRQLAAASEQGNAQGMELLRFSSQTKHQNVNSPPGQGRAQQGDGPSGTPPGHLADILVACFEPEFGPRLAMVDAVDVVPRLSLALDILQQKAQGQAQGALKEEKEGGQGQGGPELQAQVESGKEAKEKSREKSPEPQDFFSQTDKFSKGHNRIQFPATSPPPNSRSSTSSRGARGASDMDAADDDEDDVAALERRLEAAGLPGHAWKHVKREIRRLQKMQPQQPGYSTSMQYLELLADLPWNTPPQHSSSERVGRIEQHLGASGLNKAKPGKEGEGEGSLGPLKTLGIQLQGEFKIDVDAAKDQLDKEHFGLGRVKQRIVEYIAVRKLKPDAMGPVLCFVGPPGVGKTSLAASIASALGRKFVRIALGGVKDEADIRGHRRTYVGSMPGRIIEGIKRAGVNNPVMLLDELDKTGTDARGDPAAALLEVLDPEQNKCFTDHYVGLPFDLSRVVFLATANRTRPIPPPLLDRMEVIEIPGYTPEEKKRIALSHLIPKILDSHGLTKHQLVIQAHVVDLIINRYTREAGVRTLSRHLAALARAAAVKVAQSRRLPGVAGALGRSGEEEQGEGMGMELEMEMGVEALGLQAKDIAEAMVEMEPIVATEETVESVLGPSKFDGNEVATRVATPGVAVGLVWTAVGGEVQFVEASKMAGKGELHLTGQLGDVIKESAQIALTWVRSKAAEILLAQPPLAPSTSTSSSFKCASGVKSSDTTQHHQQQQQQQQQLGAQTDDAMLPSAHVTLGLESARDGREGGTHVSEEQRVYQGQAFGADASGLERVGLARWALGVSEADESSGADLPVSIGLVEEGSKKDQDSPSPRQTIGGRRKGGRSRQETSGVADLMAGQDVHIHFPAGAVPKDGPSAGVTLVTALVSLLTQRCVRADTAMTGEITLRGLTLPVGGIKEKILAAHRCGIRRVILPQLNLKEVLTEVPAETLACMEILPTKRMEDVLQEAFHGGCPANPISRL